MAHVQMTSREQIVWLVLLLLIFTCIIAAFIQPSLSQPLVVLP